MNSQPSVFSPFVQIEINSSFLIINAKSKTMALPVHILLIIETFNSSYIFQF